MKNEKTIDQLLLLQNNPHYQFTEEEQARLNAFLALPSEQRAQAQSSGNSSEKNIPATVLNKNIVKKETGEIPTINNVVDKKASEAEAVEEIVHPDAVK